MAHLLGLQECVRQELFHMLPALFIESPHVELNIIVSPFFLL